MMEDEVIMTAEERWAELDLLREEYKSFDVFLYDVIEDLLGFKCTWLQVDIARFLEHGPKHKMIQAQRGQAKTTVTAAYAVWRLIHDPTTRVLIVSSGSDMATEISNWVIQIIMGMPELACLRPDRSAGDRASVKAFDVHYALKGAEKSPSIACVGITSNLQGKRADLLIADDVESAKNSQTDTNRERLRHLTLDFTSICSVGDIVYLGTPQSVDSIYNGLPSRGYEVRIWTGRFPTEEEEKNYNGYLAPSLVAKMAEDPTLRTGGGPTGDRGKPTDPVLLDETALSAKEIDQGKAYFQLQHMLDTRLTDAERFPLKSGGLVFMHIPAESAPITINWVASEANRVFPPQGFPINETYYRAQGFGTEHGAFQGTHMYVDPAGGGKNGDETAYAVTKFLAGKVFLVDVGGVPGGLNDASLDKLTAVVKKWKPSQVSIEKNFGNGALSSIWTPKLLKEHNCAIEDVWESGQKELRIIDVLEPLIGAQKLIVDEGLLVKDWERCSIYDPDRRATYSMFFQLARITRDKNCLAHDDRLDAVAGACRFWVDHLKQDEDKAAARAAEKRWRQQIENPLGRPDFKMRLPGGSPNRAGLNGGLSALSKTLRRR